MKSLATKVLMWIALLCTPIVPANLRGQGSQGQHQSGIIGYVDGGILIATADGDGSSVVPDRVRVYSDSGALVAEIATREQGKACWHFEARLKPGAYKLVAYAGPPPEEGGRLYSYPVAVTVGKKQFTHVVLSFHPAPGDRFAVPSLN